MTQPQITAAEPVTYRRARLVSMIMVSEDEFRLRNERNGKVIVVDSFTYALWAFAPRDGGAPRGAILEQLQAMAPEPIDPAFFDATIGRLVSAGFLEKGTVQRGYDALAEEYDARPPYAPFVFDFIREHTTAHHRSRILEVGCGTGGQFGGLASLSPERLCGIDVSLGMLEVAEKRIAREALAATVVHGMAEVMPFNDGEFSSLVLAAALHWLDPGPFWAEAARVLDPDNRAFVVLRLPDARSANALANFVTDAWGPYWQRMVFTIAQGLPHHVDVLRIETRPDEMVIESPEAFVQILHGWAPLPPGKRWNPDSEIVRKLPAFPLHVPCVTALVALRVLKPPPNELFAIGR